ncbi:DUF3011 domain-containing protein [Rhodanobacter aciditrophus]|uniref:DUF3011 domain-containing protein n=1 Tax=Rhodanobacter aciditrophus TaxID=1623218 RepID=UPI003CF6F280
MHSVLRIVLAFGVLPLAAGFAADSAQAQRYGDRGQDPQVYCASNDSRGTRCQMPWRHSVLVQQMSRAACIEGRTWGSDPYSVWIKDGCRGNFGNAHAYGWYGRRDHDGDRDDYRDDDRGAREVYCASNDDRGARCQMPWRHSVLARQMSDSACIEGRTWGSDPYSVWVKGGCRGQFREARGYRPRW